MFSSKHVKDPQNTVKQINKQQPSNNMSKKHRTDTSPKKLPMWQIKT